MQHITSPDPLAKPRINPEMLSHPADAFQLAHAARHVHDMCIDPTSSVAEFLDLPKAGPGHLVPLHMDGAAYAMGEDAEDQAWEDWVRSNARTERELQPPLLGIVKRAELTASARYPFAQTIRPRPARCSRDRTAASSTRSCWSTAPRMSASPT